MKTNWDLTHLYRTQEEWNKDYVLTKEEFEFLNDVLFEDVEEND